MSRTRLTISVEYDPAVTDPESLASALARLMETACLRPGILDEHGNPRMGPFYVANDEQPPTIVVNVDDGVLQDVFCTLPDTRLIMVDWGCDGQPAGGRVVDVPGHGLAAVEETAVSPMGALVERDVEKAIHAAGISLSVCECAYPGMFNCGVPGILAHLENGRLIDGGTAERCDLCRRYPSDEAALERLRELGLA
jgi:hypothetical protein